MRAITGRLPVLLAFLLAFCGFAASQSEVQKRTLVINGQHGEATIYRIEGRLYVSLETLVHIANGSISFQGTEIILSIPSEPPEQASDSAASDSSMSNSFMQAASQDLALIKEWYAILGHAIQRGVPGDGSRLLMYRDRAAAGLRLAGVEASTVGDQSALRLLTNHFNDVDKWHVKLMEERKSMSTAKYSVTENALKDDADFQKIANCSNLLSSMFSGSSYQDDGSCH